MKKPWRAVIAWTMAALVLLVLGGVSLILYSNEQNKTFHVSAYTVTNEKIPVTFEGKRIVLLGDLHNKDCAQALATSVRAQNPDAIFITGDWISRYTTDISPAVEAAQALTEIAPVCFVAGNHEAWAAMWSDLHKELLACGITVLQNSAVLWKEGEDAIEIIGMFDTEFSTHIVRDAAPLIKEDLFSVLLLHRPEYAPEAASFGFDLMLSGHTHGGQIRLPLIGSVYAPNQGWFPKYDVGQFDVDDMDLIVTQGLGESEAMRILTPPEIVAITLDNPTI